MKYLIITALLFLGWCADASSQQLSSKTKKSSATSAATTTGGQQKSSKTKKSSTKNKSASTSVSSLLSLSENDIAKALKEALTNGAKISTAAASAVDGFYKNPKIAIPWPPEAERMKTVLDKVGLDKQIASFEQSMNRAAEEAAGQVVDIFVAAIKDMTIKDGIAIVQGCDTAATQYLRTKTTASLTQKLTPIVKTAIDKVKVTSYWTPLIKEYNRIPRLKKINPNLENYITTKTIDGLMTLIAEQERKIRQDPAAQVSDILRRVFGK